MDSKIHKRLVAFVTQMQEGPLGRIPLDRAIKANLDLFLKLRESGATWAQIANGLTSAGARRSDGRLISADQVRSSVSRQLRTKTIDQPTKTGPSTDWTTPSAPKLTEELEKPYNPTPETSSTMKKTIQEGAVSIIEKLNRVRRLRG